MAFEGPFQPKPLQDPLKRTFHRATATPQPLPLNCSYQTLPWHFNRSCRSLCQRSPGPGAREENAVPCGQRQERLSVPGPVRTAPAALTPPAHGAAAARCPGLPSASCTATRCCVSSCTTTTPRAVWRSKTLVCGYREGFKCKMLHFVLFHSELSSPSLFSLISPDFHPILSLISSHVCYSSAPRSERTTFSPPKTSQGNTSSTFPFSFGHGTRESSD